MTSTHPAPNVLPVLSRGKHRTPRKGACFMELASFLAGERWSDHPSCTHPLLAELARLVNDYTSDAHRPALGALIPSVVGLTSDDPRVDPAIAWECARRALPVVAGDRQNVMAVAVLTADRVLAVINGTRLDRLSDATLLALDAAPAAAEWAYGRTQRSPVSVEGFRRYRAPDAVRYAVQGLAEACVPDADATLRELLATGIDVVEASSPRPEPDTFARTVDTDSWHAACRLTSTR